MKQLFFLGLAASILGFSASMAPHESVAHLANSGLPHFFEHAPPATISGTVKYRSDNNPVEGVFVSILKNGLVINRTQTDAQGNYTATAESGGIEAQFELPGHVTQRITAISLSESAPVQLSVWLEKDAGLGETVVRSFQAHQAMNGKTGDRVRVEALKAVPAEGAGKYAGEGAGKRETTPGAPRDKAGKADKDAARMMKPAKTEAPPRVDDYKAVDMITTEEAPAKSATFSEKEAYAKIAGDFKSAPTPGGPAQPSPRAGLLTAGEWSDLHNWNRHWTDLLTDGEIDAYQTQYGIFPQHRYTLLVTNDQDFPIADAPVQWHNRWGELLWETRTDNTGKAELWAGLFGALSSNAAKVEAPVSNTVVSVAANGQTYTLANPKPAKDGPNRLRIAAPCDAPAAVDILWVVDATGSMGDEIEYLKTELLDVIGRAKSHNPGRLFRMGTVFYRDQTDEYITKSSNFSADISQTVEFIGRQRADGGGDYPEAVHSALEAAVFSQRWSEKAIARICFLVLDASPHQKPEVNASIHRCIREAARLGIRVVPVAASGIQKDTEFLLKFFGLATNGTYVFLTDHSGIGGKHLEPTSDEYKVEPLNQLLVRLITEYTTIETCEGKSPIRFDSDGQTQQNGNGWQAFYYPNPASTQFNLDLPFDVQSVTLYDAEGKAVRSLTKPGSGQHQIVVSDLAEGFYTLRILKDGQMQSGKLMVIRS